MGGKQAYRYSVVTVLCNLQYRFRALKEKKIEEHSSPKSALCFDLPPLPRLNPNRIPNLACSICVIGQIDDAQAL